VRGAAQGDRPGLGEPARTVTTTTELAALLRTLRRRHARESADGQLTYRELAARTGWSHGIIGEYLTGNVLPPIGRFDELVSLLGARPAEQRALATARDRVEEHLVEEHLLVRRAAQGPVRARR
jgi:transcriptional regulator with XRE-family HTH domain